MKNNRKSHRKASWNIGKKDYIYHVTTTENYEQIKKDGMLKPNSDGVLFFSVGKPLLSYGEVVLRSRYRLSLKKFGASSPPVVWSEKPMSLFTFKRVDKKESIEVDERLLNVSYDMFIADIFHPDIVLYSDENSVVEIDMLEGIRKDYVDVIKALTNVGFHPIGFSVINNEKLYYYSERLI